MKILVCLFLIVSGSNCDATILPDSITKQTSNAEKFILHRVVSGEGWYSIARKYEISYSELRLANKNDGDKLHIGQEILIPAKAKLNDPRFQKNYTDKKEPITSPKKEDEVQKSSEDKSHPIIHKVRAAETLFSIARTYSVSVDQIKKWNQLLDNTIEIGQELKVGMDNSLSKKDINTFEHEALKNQQEERINSSKSTKTNVIVDKEKENAQPEVNTNNTEASPEIKESTILVKTASTEKSTAEIKPDNKKYSFANGRKEVNEEGIASWLDDENINPNKYYALHRTAPIGTIVKVTNKTNGNSVFVKVVGLLPEITETDSLLIQISKASAERLGVVEKKFDAELIYGVAGN